MKIYTNDDRRNELSQTVHENGTHLHATLEVNGLISDSLCLSRSIRQGCTLVPSLFVIAKDSLHYIIKDNTFPQELEELCCLIKRK